MVAKICSHPKWNVDSQNIGTCANPKCGERRQFPFDKDGEIIVLSPSKCNSESAAGQIIKKKKRGRPKKKKAAAAPGAKSRDSPGKKRSNPHAKARYYDAHREDILRDLQKIGTAATRKKWEIPPTTLKYMIERWAMPQDEGLPAFPPFSNSWDASVQLKWLDLYGQLRGIK